MKTFIISLLVVMFATSVYAQDQEVIRLSDPVMETDEVEIFGSEWSDWSQAESLQNIVEDQQEYVDQEVLIKAEVAEVCAKKGCFFVANDGPYSARITFKDYSFFIPTDSKGKTVTFKGVFSVKELSEEKAKHYAEDAGDDPDKIEGPQKEYSIVATSVAIPKK